MTNPKFQSTILLIQRYSELQKGNKDAEALVGNAHMEIGKAQGELAAYHFMCRLSAGRDTPLDTGTHARNFESNQLFLDAAKEGNP